MAIRIREVEPGDLAMIKSPPREFAEHLNAIDELEPLLDEEIDRIERLAFGRVPVCTMLIAEVDGAVAGHLSYFWGLSTEGVAPAFFVGDLFVRDCCRGRGIGRLLMQHARDMPGRGTRTRYHRRCGARTHPTKPSTGGSARGPTTRKCSSRGLWRTRRTAIGHRSRCHRVRQTKPRKIGDERTVAVSGTDLSRR